MWTEQRLKKYREKAEISRFKPFEHEIRWHGYKMATKILKIQRKSIFSKDMMTENLENTPSVKQGFPNLIRVETDTAIRIDRLKRRERERFGNRIDLGGDMYENHREFIDWAASYDRGGLDMRSKAKHDEWQKLLQCRQILLDGSLPVEKNFEIIQQNL